jgi:hypothetical protein
MTARQPYGQTVLSSQAEDAIDALGEAEQNAVIAALLSLQTGLIPPTGTVQLRKKDYLYLETPHGFRVVFRFIERERRLSEVSGEGQQRIFVITVVPPKPEGKWTSFADRQPI